MSFKPRLSPVANGNYGNHSRGSIAERWVKEAAFYIWEKEGRSHGHDLDHWLAQRKKCGTWSTQRRFASNPGENRWRGDRLSEHRSIRPRLMRLEASRSGCSPAPAQRLARRAEVGRTADEPRDLGLLDRLPAAMAGLARAPIHRVDRQKAAFHSQDRAIVRVEARPLGLDCQVENLPGSPGAASPVPDG